MKAHNDIRWFIGLIGSKFFHKQIIGTIFISEDTPLSKTTVLSSFLISPGCHRAMITLLCPLLSSSSLSWLCPLALVLKKVMMQGEARVSDDDLTIEKFFR